MATRIRSSQRAPKACQRCARMRIKCDKRIPCQTCLVRGLEVSCARETVKVRGKTIATNPAEVPPTYAALLEENRILKAAFESTLNSSDPQVGHPCTSVVETFEAEIQDINLRRSSRVKHVSDIYIPSLVCSKALLEHGAVWTSWIHFAVHIPTFQAEHDRLWQGVEGAEISFLDHDPFWLAIYFAFIAMSSMFMNEQEAEAAGLPNESLTKHLENWYDASLFFLERADYLRHHDTRTIQAIAILLGLFKNVGDFSLYSILLAVGIRIGQSLGIDQMDSLSIHNVTSIDNNAFIRREVIRRAWWTLIICDWLQRPPCSPCIRNSDFSINLPLDLDDEELQNPAFQTNPARAGHRPRPIQYHTTMIAVARLFHRFYLERQLVSNDLQQLEQLVLRTDETLANVINDLPLHLQGDSDISTTESQHPIWLMQRDSLSLMFLFYRLAINRVLQEQWVQSRHLYERTQAVCLGSARAIVTLVDRYQASIARHRPWSTTSNLFSAAITLATEARFCDPNTANEYREDINHCLDFFISIKHQNAVAARAIDVLERYLALEEREGLGDGE